LQNLDNFENLVFDLEENIKLEQSSNARNTTRLIRTKNNKDSQPTKNELKLLDKLNQLQIHRSVSDIWPYTFAAPK